MLTSGFYKKSSNKENTKNIVDITVVCRYFKLHRIVNLVLKHIIIFLNETILTGLIAYI